MRMGQRMVATAVELPYGDPRAVTIIATMRVLQTPPRYAPHIGGVEAVAQQICERLRAFGDQPAVLCADEPRGAPTEVNGVPVRRLPWVAKVANTNITLGLPIVRTSPDNGTAFDIAGQDLADPRPMAAAIRMAAQCANYRSDGA